MHLPFMLRARRFLLFPFLLFCLFHIFKIADGFTTDQQSQLKILKEKGFTNELLNQFKLIIYEWNIDNVLKYYKNDNFCKLYCINHNHKPYGCYQTQNMCDLLHSHSLHNLSGQIRKSAQNKVLYQVLCLYLFSTKNYDTNPMLYRYYGLFIYKTGKEMRDYLKCEKYFLHGLSLDSQCAPMHFTYAKLLDSKLGNKEKAEKHFKLAIYIDPGLVQCQLQFGMFLYHYQRYKESLVCFENGCKYRKYHCTYQFWQGKALFKLEHYTASLNCYKKCLELHNEKHTIDGIFVKLSNGDLAEAKHRIKEINKKLGLNSNRKKKNDKNWTKLNVNTQSQSSQNGKQKQKQKQKEQKQEEQKYEEKEQNKEKKQEKKDKEKQKQQENQQTHEQQGLQPSSQSQSQSQPTDINQDHNRNQKAKHEKQDNKSSHVHKHNGNKKEQDVKDKKNRQKQHSSVKSGKHQGSDEMKYSVESEEKYKDNDNINVVNNKNKNHSDSDGTLDSNDVPGMEAKNSSNVRIHFNPEKISNSLKDAINTVGSNHLHYVNSNGSGNGNNANSTNSGVNMKTIDIEMDVVDDDRMYENGISRGELELNYSKVDDFNSMNVNPSVETSVNSVNTINIGHNTRDMTVNYMIDENEEDSPYDYDYHNHNHKHSQHHNNNYDHSKHKNNHTNNNVSNNNFNNVTNYNHHHNNNNNNNISNNRNIMSHNPNNNYNYTSVPNTSHTNTPHAHASHGKKFNYTSISTTSPTGGSPILQSAIRKDTYNGSNGNSYNYNYNYNHNHNHNYSHNHSQAISPQTQGGGRMSLNYSTTETTPPISPLQHHNFVQQQMAVYTISNPLVIMIGIGHYASGKFTRVNGVADDYNNMIKLFVYKWNFAFVYQTDDNKTVFLTNNSINNNKNKNKNKSRLYQSNFKLAWTGSEIDSFVGNVVKAVDKGNVNKTFDSLLFIVSSHGENEHVILDTNNEEYQLTEIYQKFCNSKGGCHCLKNKPKIFCIDVCHDETVASIQYALSNNNGKRDKNVNKNKKNKFNKNKSNLQRKKQSLPSNTISSIMSENRIDYDNFCWIYGSLDARCLIAAVKSVFERNDASGYDLNKLIGMIRNETLKLTNSEQIVNKKSRSKKNNTSSLSHSQTMIPLNLSYLQYHVYFGKQNAF